MFPIYFIAIVLRRIMARRDHYACNTAKVPNRKGKLRHGMQRFIKIRLDSVLRKHKRRLACERIAHPPGIVRDGDTARRPIRKRADVFCKAFRSTPNHMHVHAVRTCADDAAQARSAEFQLRIKAFLNLLFIACKSQQLSPQRRVKPFLSQPLPVYRFRLLHTHLFPSEKLFLFLRHHCISRRNLARRKHGIARHAVRTAVAYDDMIVQRYAHRLQRIVYRAGGFDIFA